MPICSHIYISPFQSRIIRKRKAINTHARRTTKNSITNLPFCRFRQILKFKTKTARAVPPKFIFFAVKYEKTYIWLYAKKKIEQPKRTFFFLICITKEQNGSQNKSTFHTLLHQENTIFFVAKWEIFAVFTKIIDTNK